MLRLLEGVSHFDQSQPNHRVDLLGSGNTLHWTINRMRETDIADLVTLIFVMALITVTILYRP